MLLSGSLGNHCCLGGIKLRSVRPLLLHKKLLHLSHPCHQSIQGRHCRRRLWWRRWWRRHRQRRRCCSWKARERLHPSSTKRETTSSSRPRTGSLGDLGTSAPRKTPQTSMPARPEAKVGTVHHLDQSLQATQEPDHRGVVLAAAPDHLPVVLTATAGPDHQGSSCCNCCARSPPSTTATAEPDHQGVVLAATPLPDHLEGVLKATAKPDRCTLRQFHKRLLSPVTTWKPCKH